MPSSKALIAAAVIAAALLIGMGPVGTSAQSGPETQTKGLDLFPTREHRPEVERWRPLVSEIFPIWEVEDVLGVMGCESRGNPDVHFMEEWGQYSIGLMQINEGWLTGWGESEWALVSHNEDPVDLTDPATNLQAASFVRHFEDTTGKRPWSQWACNPSGRVG